MYKKINTVKLLDKDDIYKKFYSIDIKFNGYTCFNSYMFDNLFFDDTIKK